MILPHALLNAGRNHIYCVTSGCATHLPVAFSLGTAWSRDTERGIEEHLYGVLHVDVLGGSLPLGLAAGCCVLLCS